MSTQDSAAAGGSDPLTLARAEMAAGERLIWADTSLPGNARRRVLPVSILGWLFLLLSLAWMAKAAIASFWLLIMGLPFLLAAAAIAGLPWWWPTITRHTVYAISDRRLLIIQSWPRRKVRSYGPDDIDVVERREKRDGSGDIVFRREEYRKLRHHHDPQGKRRTGEREIGFFGVPDVKTLEEAIWALKEKRSIMVDEGDGNDAPASSAENTASAEV
ncbi:MAG: hypothetical protein R3F54_17710 [Alphaproteobacteria bacterium]